MLTLSNAIGIKEGAGNQIIIIGAHYDTFCPNCPIADDNTCGVAEVGIAIEGRDGKWIRAPEVRELTEEERGKAREVALSDPELKNIMNGKNYKMEIRPTGVIITNEAGEVETKFDGTSVMFVLEDGIVYFVRRPEEGKSDKDEPATSTTDATNK